MTPDTYIDTIQAPTLTECRMLIRERYGERARILNHKIVRSGGFLGLFSKESVVVSVVVPPLKIPDIPKSLRAASPKPADPGAGVGEILNQIKALGDKIDTSLAAPQRTAPGTNEHGTLVKLGDDLERNDFSPSFRREILERVRREFSLEDLNDYAEVQQKVLAWIGERVKIYTGGGPYKRPRIIVLVGPTGVGKTTTVCKLAASLKYPDNSNERLELSLITIDMYRIAAAKQLGELATYLKADFIAVEDQEELKKELAFRSDSFDAILIDTVGRSPHDSLELAKMKKMLEVCGPDAEVYLTFMASAKYNDIMETMRQFEPFGYRAVIVTKLDETKQLGNVLSALAVYGKPIAFVTNGQPSTPRYIKKAGIVDLLTNLEGFTLDRERLEAYFTYGGAYGRQNS
ncbi:MAG: flagellar biosynthesis protein FlhF [Spirochaetaceae bacterium]|jgi:flagellar biosynthesis protein FlhF|nr:flagellar biosynthesis protein FlhF [Spirochaetaceae bacterium]